MELPTSINQQHHFNFSLSRHCFSCATVSLSKVRCNKYVSDEYHVTLLTWSFECKARHSWHTGRNLCDSWIFLELEDASSTRLGYGKPKKFIAQQEEGELFTAEMMNWDAGTSEQLALPGTCKSGIFWQKGVVAELTPQEEVTLTDRLNWGDHRRRLRCYPGTPPQKVSGQQPFQNVNDHQWVHSGHTSQGFLVRTEEASGLRGETSWRRHKKVQLTYFKLKKIFFSTRMMENIH